MSRRSPSRTIALTATMLAAGTLPFAPATLVGQVSPAHATVGPDSAKSRVRLRVVGVFDEETGAPIEGADVTDLETGVTARTTKTGTMALLFVDTTGTLIKIKKVGYQQSVMAVATGGADTTPVTTMLLHAGHALTPVIVVGNRSVLLSPSDTVSTLLKNGFYERRLTSAAPSSAFITGDKIAASMVLSDARFFGRPICENNVYIDGLKFTPSKRTGHFLREGIDAISPQDIAGIETYSLGEMPINTAHTIDGPQTLSPEAAAVASANASMAGMGCVTMIWLKR